MSKDPQDLLKENKWTILLVISGFLFGWLIVSLGFWKLIVVAFFTLLGYLLGRYFDQTKRE